MVLFIQPVKEGKKQTGGDFFIVDNRDV